MSAEAEKFIALVVAKGDFVTDVDGFDYFWPSNEGALSSHHLRWLADELDRRNAGWNAQIERYFEIENTNE